jgi:hypothetical protein
MVDRPQAEACPMNQIPADVICDAQSQAEAPLLYDQVAPLLPRLSDLAARMATTIPKLPAGILVTSGWGAGGGCGF